MKKYGILKNHLRGVIAVGKALGYTVTPGGLYFCGGVDDALLEEGKSPQLCLLGTISAVTGEALLSGYDIKSSQTMCGLDLSEIKSLEAGFCGWDRAPSYVIKQNDDLFALGKELARELTE